MLLPISQGHHVCFTIAASKHATGGATRARPHRLGEVERQRGNEVFEKILSFFRLREHAQKPPEVATPDLRPCAIGTARSKQRQTHPIHMKRRVR